MMSALTSVLKKSQLKFKRNEDLLSRQKTSKVSTFFWKNKLQGWWFAGLKLFVGFLMIKTQNKLISDYKQYNPHSSLRPICTDCTFRTGFKKNNQLTTTATSQHFECKCHMTGSLAFVIPCNIFQTKPWLKIHINKKKIHRRNEFLHHSLSGRTSMNPV